MTPVDHKGREMLNRTAYRGSALAAALVLLGESPLCAQPYPSTTIRVTVAAAAGTPPDIISRVVANELSAERGLARGGREQAGRRPDHRRHRGAQAAGGRILDLCHGAAGECRAGIPAQYAVSRGCRLRPGHQDFDLVQRARDAPVGSGPNGVGTRRAHQEPARQADIFLRRFRDARASHRRDVQAADRRAHHPRSLPAVPAGHCGSPQRHQPLHVHHVASGGRSDQHRQAACVLPSRDRSGSRRSRMFRPSSNKASPTLWSRIGSASR